MPASHSAPTCPKCLGPTKVKSNLNDHATYDLIRLRQCLDCKTRFYTRQSREKLITQDQIRWRKADRTSRTVSIVAD